MIFESSRALLLVVREIYFVDRIGMWFFEKRAFGLNLVVEFNCRTDGRLIVEILS